MTTTVYNTIREMHKMAFSTIKNGMSISIFIQHLIFKFHVRFLLWGFAKGMLMYVISPTGESRSVYTQLLYIYTLDLL